jgi:hypothetical protein
VPSSSFTINSGQTKTIGFKITSSSEVLNVLNTSFKINSNSVKSCQNPLSLILFEGGQNSMTWTSALSSGYYECGSSNIYGDYEANYAQSTPATLTNSKFCNLFNLSAFPEIKIGANLSGTGAANFSMSIYSNSLDVFIDKSCSFSILGSSQEGCIINESSSQTAEYYVCISQTFGSAYTINYDAHSPTGYWETDGNKYDWQVYALAASYAPITNVILNNTNIANFADETLIYLQEIYGPNVNCSLGCIVPFKFISNLDNQQITVSDANLKYFAGPAQITESNIYDVSMVPSLISMPFKLLYLNFSGLKAPTRSGVYNLSLKLNDQLIFKKQIEVLSLPIIENISTQKAPAAIDTTFIVYVTGANITNYKWDFGDNTTLDTSINSVIHKYNSVGKYNLVITAKNFNGEVSSNFSIDVVSPKEYLTSTISDYKKRVTDLRLQTSFFPVAVKNYLEKRFNFTGIDIQLTGLQVQYNSAGNDSQKYIAIANALTEITLPKFINTTSKSSGKFIFNKNSVNAMNLKAISSQESSASNEEIQNATFAWFLESLDVLATSQIYSEINGNLSTPLLSYVSLTLNPKTSLQTVYLMINRPKSLLEFNSAEGTDLNDSVGVSFDLTNGQRTFDFLIAEEVSILNLPIYFAPPISELVIISNFSLCNFDKICNSNNGETYSNCRSDCKPWGKAWIWIIVALFFVFCLYIAAQEWYKRRYESYLFKDKNDLYNLTHFMDNAEKQKLQKEEYLAKLNERAWPREQTIYAYRKYKGLRTGMWEIPIFKFLENKKVSSEIELRKRIGINPNFAPRPIRPFVRPIKPMPKVPGAPINQRLIVAQNNSAVQQQKLMQSNQKLLDSSKPVNSTNQEKEKENTQSK